MATFSPIKNKLMMPGGPAPGPYQDASAEAYPLGTMAPSAAPKSPVNPLAFAANFMPQQRKPDAMYAFAETLERTLTPDAAKQRVEEEKAGQADKLKQGLAFVQQLRALPANQRYQMAQVGLKQFGLDASLDPQGFTDEALAQSEAALSAQAGIAPQQPMEINNQLVDPRTREVLADYRDPEKVSGDKLKTEVGANGNYWSFNTSTGKMEDTGVKAPASKVSGKGAGGASGVQSVHVDQSTGLATAVMRDGSTKDLGFQPVQTQIVDVGGVPTLVSKIPGAQTQSLSTADEVGANQGTIEGFKVLGKKQADAISVLPEAISTSERVIRSIDELLNAPGFDGAYGINRFLPQNQLPGSDAKNAQAIIGKLDGQFFVNAVTAMQVSLAPVSDADALRLVASISQLSNLDISPAEARRVAGELKDYFRKARSKAEEAAKRGPIKTPLANAPQQTPPKSWVTRQAERFQPPTQKLPPGVTQEMWDVMTEDERAEFAQ